MFKVMLAFKREIWVNLTRNMVMSNGLNQLNVPEYKHECTKKFFFEKNYGDINKKI